MKVEEIHKDTDVKAEVCIIGSGAGGSAVAYGLAKVGRDVVVLEKGEFYDVKDLDDMRELDLLELWKNRSAQVSRASLEDFPVSIAQGECVGGSTVLNYGICFRTPDKVLERWSREFGVKDISPPEMKKWFDQVWDTLSVTQLTGAGPAHEVFKRGCDLLGYEGDWMSRNCKGCNSKQSALVAYLEWANERGARIFPRCTVEKIRVKNKRATGVEGKILDANRKRAYKLRVVDAKIVVLSAGPIASSQLLLQNNLANSSGLVGRGLSLHPSPAIIAEFDYEVKRPDDLPMAYYCTQFSIHNTGQPGFVMESILLPPVELALVVPSLGFRHKELMKKYPYYASAGILVQDEPNGNITLNWGNEAVVDYRLGDREISFVKQGMREAARAFFKAGARRVITSHLEETILESEADLHLIDEKPIASGTIALVSAHPQGGNRLGSDPRVSVVDSYCESHDIAHLFVCDASVFPTSVGVNPQISVMAFATRTASHINQNPGKYFA